MEEKNSLLEARLGEVGSAESKEPRTSRYAIPEQRNGNYLSDMAVVGAFTIASVAIGMAAAKAAMELYEMFGRGPAVTSF